MNNNEKRKYMTDLMVFQATPFMSEFKTRRDFLKKTPLVLYKYRPFDKYAFEMIENQYAYLAPVKGLDDPFDCLNDFNIKDFYDEKNKKITPKAIDFIVKQVCPHGIQNLSVKEVKKLAFKCVDENGINMEKVPMVIRKSGSVINMEPEPLFIVLNSFNDNFRNIIDDTKTYRLANTAMNPSELIGICSLSEQRDNKVMWSLYGNRYKGYCIEYEVPKINQVIACLYPVIYTKRKNNKFIEKILEYSMGAFMRAVTSGHQSGNIGALNELFCTKDTDWSHQVEWRLIGNAKDHFKYLKIKAVYLGFKVSSINENKMKKYACEYGFDLYKMDSPNGKKKITYTKLNLSKTIKQK